MDRRRFLSRGLGLATLGLASGSALANADTFQRFHAALPRHPRLYVFADTVGAQSGTATIEGRLPRDLEGSFFRNGPGRFELGGERYHHWFDGDGFAQRWQIIDGKVRHLGRFVETQKYVDETAAGQFLYNAFGTAVDRRPVKNNETMNAANTNLLPFHGKLYALWEGGSATEVDPENLSTIGVKTWREDLKAMPFSAHPKVDPAGGMWNFGALPGGGRLALYRLDAQGTVQQAGVVELPQLAMVHDFAVSAAHLVFLIAPYDLLDDPALSFADRHQWAGSGDRARPLRVVVIAKESLQIRRIYEIAPRSVFHFGNAWDDGDTTHLDVVLHQGDSLGGFGALMRGEQAPHVPGHSATIQLALNHVSGNVREAQLFGDSEFPRVMPQVVGQRHRRLAVVGTASGTREQVLNTVSVIDTDSGKADSYRFGKDWLLEEHVLVPRRSARSESDGYLVGVAQDTRRGQTVLTVFDAARVSAGPLALARLAYRAPHCFHGNFLSA
ncbi:carotenoid oxygenase family protein [Oxalobacteraceae bacterium]|nr:carotenoid oxygenase family protein [Oxalobacteraceae bacterium]